MAARRMGARPRTNQHEVDRHVPLEAGCKLSTGSAAKRRQTVLVPLQLQLGVRFPIGTLTRLESGLESRLRVTQVGGDWTVGSQSTP